MTASQQPTDHRRHRLAANHNETIEPDGTDEFDTEGHRLAANDNETVVPDDDEQDTEGHRLAANDNETVVEGAAPPDPEADDDAPTPGPRRSLTRNHSETLVDA
jgi:hypothetical protein